MIIDFHTHTFPKSISSKAVESLSIKGHTRYFSDGSREDLAIKMKQAGIDYSVNLPVMTRAGQVSQVNDSLIRQKEELLKKGIISFGGLHPEFEDYKAEIRKLKNAGIKGVKFHPAFQGGHINDISYKRMIDAISEAGLITIVHSGLDVGKLDENCASVPELLDLIEDVKPEKLVLAHMGGWQAFDEVEKYLAGAPIWLDTSYSLGAVYARPGQEERMPYKYNLSQEAFLKLVRRHGADRVLFASDSPWADQKAYVDFVKGTLLEEEELEKVLGGNAALLLFS